MSTIDLRRLGSAYSVESTIFEHATRGLCVYRGQALRGVCRDWRARFVGPTDVSYRMYMRIVTESLGIGTCAATYLLGWCMRMDMLAATEVVLRYMATRDWRDYRLDHGDSDLMPHSYTLVAAAIGKREDGNCLVQVAHGLLCGCKWYCRDGDSQTRLPGTCRFDSSEVLSAFAAHGVVRGAQDESNEYLILHQIKAAMMHGHTDAVRQLAKSECLQSIKFSWFTGVELDEITGHWLSRGHPELQGVNCSSCVHRQLMLRASASKGDVDETREVLSKYTEFTRFEETTMLHAALLSGSRPILEFLVRFFWPKCTDPSGGTIYAREQFIDRLIFAVNKCVSSLCAVTRSWLTFKHQRAPVCELLSSASSVIGTPLKLTIRVLAYGRLKHDVFRALREEEVSIHACDIKRVRETWALWQVAEIDEAFATGKWKVIGRSGATHL